MAVNFTGPSGNVSEKDRQKIAAERAAELRARIADYLDASRRIPTGFALADVIDAYKERLRAFFRAGEEEWNDWRWQLRHRITDPDTLRAVIRLSAQEAEEIKLVSRRFRWAVSPYYLALAAAGGVGGPTWLQAIPSVAELEDDSGSEDPMHEALTSPVPGITRRYPDRLIINVTNQCPMYCRHCQRRRNIGEFDRHQPRKVLENALAYIRAHSEIRDVLITGGDALMLSDATLDWLLGELDRIPHVEIKRLGTRAIVTLPQRVTPELCRVLEKHPPVYINTQFNHPLEVTREAAEACAMLIKAGVVLGNQAVLLKGVNNDPCVMKKLNHELLKIRVRPYYIFHAKPVRGTMHFVTTIDEGLAIMEKLRGYTSGLAVPTYIINAPGGYGKVPILPAYLLAHDARRAVLRTWENRIIIYPNGRP